MILDLLKPLLTSYRGVLKTTSHNHKVNSVIKFLLGSPYRGPNEEQFVPRKSGARGPTYSKGDRGISGTREDGGITGNDELKGSKGAKRWKN